MTRQIRLALRAYGVGGPGQHSLWKDPRIPKNASIDIDWYIAQAKAAEHDVQLAVQRGPTLSRRSIRSAAAAPDGTWSPVSMRGRRRTTDSTSTSTTPPATAARSSTSTSTPEEEP